MRQAIEKRWRLRVADESAIKSLVDGLTISPLLARLLVNRGVVAPDAAARFLSPALSELPDPFLLPDMMRAVDRLVTARRLGETVCVYGDYDVDGITSVALLMSFFRALGISCMYHIPRRLEEGYGLSAEGLASVAARGAKVVVVEKGAVIRSGDGGAGVDHWHGAFTNPCSKITEHERLWQNNLPMPIAGIAGM